jgi:hypothetical protein
MKKMTSFRLGMAQIQYLHTKMYCYAFNAVAEALLMLIANTLAVASVPPAVASL